MGLLGLLLLLALLLVLLLASVSCAASPGPDRAVSEAETVVLVLVEDLTWEAVRESPLLAETFDNGAVANLSTSQGAASADPRMGYVLLGAGSRVDASLLPENLPKEPAEVVNAFEGPAAAVRPGSLGEALDRAGLQAAAIGEKARLVVMDAEGRVPHSYNASEPVGSLEKALAEDTNFIAVQAGSVRQAGRLADAAERAGARVAIASANAPAGSANLTPFVLAVPEKGLLYSPATRTRGLITSSDVVPILLAQIGIDPPPDMQGRAAAVLPGSVEAAVRLDERLSFVAEKRFQVWLLVAGAMLAGTFAAISWKAKAGAIYALLVLSALPAGALAVAALPVTNVVGVTFLTLCLAGVLVTMFHLLSRKITGSVAAQISGVFLVVSALILADATTGGTLMKLSTLGYNPAQGTRFYGIGNEYAAFLAGSLTVGTGALSHWRRLPLVPALIVGLVSILVLGLPSMGADVGGSLALGFGFGATLGFVRGSRLREVTLWAGGGLFTAATLFLLSGRLFPGVSHGSRAAGGETSLPEIVLRKLLLSLDLLLNPLFLLIFTATLVVIFLGWRRTRGTTLGAGLIGATITALASGALNDSGILAAIFVLAYPTVAAGVFLLSRAEKPGRVQ